MTRMRATSIKEENYWRMFELPRGDVETAIKSNLTYLTVTASLPRTPTFSINTIALLNSGW
jgi:hypothetical protein